MNSKVVIMLAFCFSLISLISASVTLEIQTLPDHEIFITEIDAFSSSEDAIKSPLHTFTGKNGKIVLEYFPEKTSFKLGLLLKKDNKRIISYKILEDIFHDEEIIELEFFPKGITLEDVLSSIEEEVVEDLNLTKTNVSMSNISESNVSQEIGIGNESVIENKTIEEENNGESSGILMSGYAVYQNNKLILNIISYLLGAVILVAPVYMLLKKRRKNKKDSIIPEGDDEKEFEKAEEDLKKAKERIDSLKGKKISVARQKLIDDERELMRLRKLGN